VVLLHILFIAKCAMLNVGVLVLIRHLADIMRRVILRKESVVSKARKHQERN
jgi:hypothetical protein